MNFESGKGQMSETGLKLDGGTRVQRYSVGTRKRGPSSSDKTCDSADSRPGRDFQWGITASARTRKGGRTAAKVGEMRRVPQQLSTLSAGSRQAAFNASESWSQLSC